MQHAQGQHGGGGGADEQAARATVADPGGQLPNGGEQVRRPNWPGRPAGGLRVGAIDGRQGRGVVEGGGQVGEGLAAAPGRAQRGVGGGRFGVAGDVAAVAPVGVGGGGDFAPGGADLLVGQVGTGRQAERVERVHGHRPGPRTSSRLAGIGSAPDSAGAASRRGAGRSTGTRAGSRLSGEALGRATWTKVAAPRWM